MSLLSKELCYTSAAAVASMVGAICDVRSRRIPNQWTGGCMVVGLLLHVCLNGWQGLGDAALAGLLAGSGFLVIYAARGMGAGDVKMMAATGCLAGLARLPSVLITTVIAGAVMAVAMAIYHRQLRQTLGRAFWILAGHGNSSSTVPAPKQAATTPEPSLSMPFAVPIAFGSMCTLYFQLSR